MPSSNVGKTIQKPIYDAPIDSNFARTIRRWGRTFQTSSAIAARRRANPISIVTNPRGLVTAISYPFSVLSLTRDRASCVRRYFATTTAFRAFLTLVRDRVLIFFLPRFATVLHTLLPLLDGRILTL